MIKKDLPYITVSAQLGDPSSSLTIGTHLLELRKLLERECNNHYGEGIDEFAPILRVDGDIWHWEFEGLQKLRLMRKQRYITVDIGVPKSRWQNVTAQEIRQYLLENVKLALEAFVKKLKKEHIRVDEKRLFADFARVERDYLASKSI
jgi:hypothetical protein